MQDLKNTSTSMSKKPNQPAVLKTVEHLVDEFERLLASELHLLKTGQADGLVAIADAKRTIVEQIGEVEPLIIPILQEKPQSNQVATLIRRLQQCRTHSNNNHTLVMLELKHTNRSLELLRSVLDMDDLSLYSQRGEVHVSREKRRIGSA